MKMTSVCVKEINIIKDEEIVTSRYKKECRPKCNNRTDHFIRRIIILLSFNCVEDADLLISEKVITFIG